jgi:hypothetical protein
MDERTQENQFANFECSRHGWNSVKQLPITNYGIDDPGLLNGQLPV